MSIILGSDIISKIYLGGSEVPRIYLGSTKVYENVSYGTRITNLITYANANGIAVPSVATLSALDTLVSDIGEAILTKTDSLKMYETDAGFVAFSCLNIIDPAKHKSIPVGSPTHSVTGFQLDGLTQYIRSGFIPSDGVNYTRNNASIGIYSTSSMSSNSGHCLLGARDISKGDSFIYFHPYYAGSRNYFDLNSGQVFESSPPPVSTPGLWSATRTTNYVTESFINGVGFDTKNTISRALGDFEVLEGAQNNNGTVQQYAPYNIGSSYYSAALTEAEHNTIKTAILTYKSR